MYIHLNNDLVCRKLSTAGCTFAVTSLSVCHRNIVLGDKAVVSAF